MARKEQKTASFGYLDLENVQKIVVCNLTGDMNDPDNQWIWDATGKTESHDPMDRCGGPFYISGVVEKESGDRWFLCTVADYAFPVTHLVNADSWSNAYEAYVDYAADHCGIAISEPDLEDYTDGGGDLECGYTSNGTPVDDSSVRCNEVRLVSVHFATNPKFKPDSH